MTPSVDGECFPSWRELPQVSHRIVGTCCCAHKLAARRSRFQRVKNYGHCVTRPERILAESLSNELIYRNGFETPFLRRSLTLRVGEHHLKVGVRIGEFPCFDGSFHCDGVLTIEH